MEINIVNCFVTSASVLCSKILFQLNDFILINCFSKDVT
jgi:hypothetical protein